MFVMQNLPVLIYQSPGTGGETIKASLEPLGFSCVHLHDLVWKDLIAGDESDPAVREGRHISRLIRAARGRSCWKVITGVRDPVGVFLLEILRQTHAWQPYIAGLSAEQQYQELKNYILEQFNAFDPAAAPARTWFDKKFDPVWNVDFFSLGFDAAGGYEIFYIENADILLYKYERLADIAAQAFGEFMGIIDLSLVHQDGLDPALRGLHDRLLGDITLSAEVLDRIYAAEYARYFYTPDEIEQLKSRWTGRRREVENYLAYGNRALEQGDAMGALLNYEQAVQLDPDCVSAYNALGSIYERAGRTAQAVRNFLEALKRSPEDKATVTNCVRILGQNGKNEDAARLARSFLEKYPHEQDQLLSGTNVTQ